MQNIKVVEETLQDRLKQVIKIYFSSQKDFAKIMGIAASNISEWWAERSSPTIATLQKICEITGVSMDWLVLGRAEPYVDELLFHNIWEEAKRFSEINQIPFTSNYLLNVQRIIIGEKKMNKNVTLQELFTKYKNILLVFKNNL